MKSPPSFFVPGPLVAGSVVSLPPEERRHARARRLRSGSEVRLIDGKGSVADGRIEAMGRAGIEVRVENSRAPERASFPLIVLAPVLRYSRLAWLIEKATELGADRIVLVSTSRAQGDRAASATRERERLSRLAREASKQCGRPSFPSIEGPAGFAEAIRTDAEDRLLLDPSGEAFPASLTGRSVALWVGPEGGFSAEERNTAESSGWRRIRLPGSLLRSETAVLAGLALAGRAIDSAAGRTDNSSTPQEAP